MTLRLLRSDLLFFLVELLTAVSRLLLTGSLIKCYDRVFNACVPVSDLLFDMIVIASVHLCGRLLCHGSNKRLFLFNLRLCSHSCKREASEEAVYLLLQHYYRVNYAAI